MTLRIRNVARLQLRLPLSVRIAPEGHVQPTAHKSVCTHTPTHTFFTCGNLSAHCHSLLNAKGICVRMCVPVCALGHGKHFAANEFKLPFKTCISATRHNN